MAALTYFVALAFLQSDAGDLLIGEPVECRNPAAAVRRAEVLSRQPHVIGAIALACNGDPNIGEYSDAIVLRKSDAIVLRKYGNVPNDLSSL